MIVLLPEIKSRLETQFLRFLMLIVAGVAVFSQANVRQCFKMDGVT